MIENSDERLKNLIAKFVLRYNYWGYLFSRIRRKSAKGFGSIMGVAAEEDGTISLLYDEDMIKNTDDQNILTILEHEGMHLLNKHLSRLIRILANETNEQRKIFKIQVWNIAADCCVNVQANIRQPIIVEGKPWKPQLPKDYGLEEGKITEEYFIELLKKSKKVKCSGNKAFNDHGQWNSKTGKVPDQHALSRKIDQNIQRVIRESAKVFTKHRGNLPSHIQDLINTALEPPKAPYYQIIRKLIKGTRFTKFKKCPTRINRKRTYSFVLNDNLSLPEISPFPGKKRDMSFDIVVLIDTSGSMGVEDIKEGLSGIKSIIEKDRHCYTTVLEVDATIEKEYVVKKVKDIQFDIKGRGGTTLYPGLERAKQLQCDVCLAFTDGYTENINSIPRKLLPKKIIWVITPNGTSKSVNETGYVVNI